MRTYKAVAFDEMTIDGAKFTFGMQSQVIYKFGGRGGHVRILLAGQEERYQLRGSEKIHVVGRVAHFPQG